MKILVCVALVSLGLTAGAARADGDPVHGEALFKRCVACHAVGPGARNRVGPELNGVVGAPIAGRNDGYKYSPALVAAGAGRTWDDAALATWLGRPSDFAKGTKMAFAGVADPQDVADLIAYLKTQTGN